MFKIYDGRNHFYQWDLDRKLIVNDAEITQVHFCNRTDDCSLVCETYQEDGLTLVNVPNILLQTDWRINVYAYDKSYTKFSDHFDVHRRSKPENYVYTETEVLNYNTLLDKINGVEENIGEAVEDYLEEHEIDVDLTGYATEDYVNEAIAGIDIPDVDLTGYATEDYVNEAVDAINIPEVDLSDYATITYVDEAIAGIDTPGGGSADVTIDNSSIIKNGTGELEVSYGGAKIITEAAQYQPEEGQLPTSNPLWNITLRMPGVPVGTCDVMGVIGGEFRIYYDVWVYGAGESGSGDEVSEYISWIATDGENVTISPGSAFQYNTTQIETFQIATREGVSYVPIDAGVIPVDDATISIVDGVLSAQSMCDEINSRIDNIEASIGEGGSGVTEERVNELIGDATADLVTEERTNELINEAMAGNDGAPEVHVGTDVPEDENIKIWVDPDEETEFATTAYVDEAIANASGGGSGAQEVYTLTSPIDTEENKAILQELFNYCLDNGTYKPNTVLVYVDGSASYARSIVLTTQFYTSGQLQLSNADDTVNIVATIDSEKNINSIRVNEYPATTVKDWLWSSSYNSVECSSSSHAKIVCYLDNDSSDIVTINVSTSNNNYFGEESGTNYCEVITTGGDIYKVVISNEGYCLQVPSYIYSLDGNSTANLNVIGYYSWG